MSDGIGAERTLGDVRMDGQISVLLALYNEERTQARHTESQRATLTNIILIVVGAGLAFVSDQELHKSSLVITIPIIAIGTYGAVATAKYFERWLRHWRRAYGYQSQLFELYPDIAEGMSNYSFKHTAAVKDTYEAEVDRRFPRLSGVRLYRLWVGFHAGIVVIGVVLTAMVLV